MTNSLHTQSVLALYSTYLVLIQTATAKGLSAYQEEGPELFLVQ